MAWDNLNLILNGRFLHDLASWTVNGATYLASDGDEQFGIAVLPGAGHYVEQDFAVVRTAAYTFHVSVKAPSLLTAGQVQAILLDSNGNTVLTANLSGAAGVWTENSLTWGLAPGGTYTLRVINTAGLVNVKVDDLWLWPVLVTRRAAAEAVHAKLGRLATERSLSPVGTGSEAEGSYTYAVDAGLRAMGAVDDETGQPDIRAVAPGAVEILLDGIEREMLERLQRDYAVEVDIAVGPRRESLSQVSSLIGKIVGDGGTQTGGKAVMRPLAREYPEG